jgi:hypothetical protein
VFAQDIVVETLGEACEMALLVNALKLVELTFVEQPTVAWGAAVAHTLSG